MNDAIAEHAEKLALIDADERDKEAKAREKAGDDQREEEDKRAEKRADALEDHLKKLQEIEDRYQSDRQDAIANRDAVALTKAEKTRAEAKKKEDADYTDRLKKIDKAFDDQTKVIKKRLDDQLKALQDNAQKSIDAENRRYAKEYQLKVDAHNQALNEEVGYNNAVAAQRALNAFSRQYWDGKLIDSGNKVDAATAQYAVNLTNYANQILNAANALPSASPYAGGSTGAGGSSGSYFRSPVATSYAQNNAFALNFAPVINASSSSQIRDMVDARLAQTLDAARRGRR